MTWWDEVTTLLEERIGLDPATVGRELIEHALRRRAAARGAAGLQDYMAALRGNDEELTELIEEVVIPESWFFRDGRPFVRLQEYAREFCGRTRTAVLRALSIPCAGGEEVYSIAIALLEAGVPTERFIVEGVDVSGRLVERARRGIFRRLSFRGDELALRQRYFREHPDGWELDPGIRDRVTFAQGNLLNPNDLLDRPAYDVIFCRNVLIYLTPSARERVLAHLEQLLAPRGLLFVGHAETLPLLPPRFTADADRGSFAFTRAPAVRAAPAEPTAARPKVSPPRSAPTPPAPPPRPMHAATSVSAAVGENDLDRAARLADERQYAGALEACARSLREQGPSARVFFLQGMIFLALGQSNPAAESLQKAVYLDDGHDEALLALALIAQGRGDAEGAARLRGRAERARRRREP